MGLLQTLFLALPDEALVLAVMAVGFLVMLGALRLRRAAAVLGSLLACLAAAPFVETLLATLPWWVGPLVLFVGAAWLLRIVLTALFGPEAAGHVIGSMIVGMFGLVVRVTLGSLRHAGRVLAAMALRGGA
jgi:hypothetical protein